VVFCKDSQLRKHQRKRLSRQLYTQNYNQQYSQGDRVIGGCRSRIDAIAQTGDRHPTGCLKTVRGGWAWLSIGGSRRVGVRCLRNAAERFYAAFAVWRQT